MTSFHSPERPRLGNGRPCWLARQVALPALHLTPAPDSEGEGLWEIELILEDHWVGIILGTGQTGLQELMTDWRRDPELVLRKWFKAEPPLASAVPAGPVLQESAGTASKTAEELDL